ncbi:hypothetical protein EXIGLDRAFT_703179 [Exidia glandulosa HHB12029]|uniref:Uncharacterized protein n=1 Tax=Exidia glandulosa HHB12029 TaxID=1314781 RepID=A0A166B387_EXIGL|nr:hypothetical protein EXIGLDRAFT_703179 [Exidia glandulosa HHB12029]
MRLFFACLPSESAHEKVVAVLTFCKTGSAEHRAVFPLEVYVAFAVLLGGKPREPFAKSAPSLVAVLGTAQKPSFLVLDKVYTKLNTIDKERWLLRAAQAATTAFSTELTSAKATEHRHHLGAVFIHLVLSSPRLETCRVAVDALKAVVKAAPNVGSVMLREALSRRDTSDGKRYQIVLGAAAPDPTTDDALKEDRVVELIVLAHARGIYVDRYCPSCGLDPPALAEKHVERLLALVLDSNQSEEARMSAVTTLTGIQPTLFLPRFIARIREALDPSKLRTLSEEDLEIWRTPEGVLCIDVLAAAKKGNAVSKAPGKGKDADNQKWEAELRESLAAKKKTSVASLSKADQAIVNAQLANESDIRRRVDGVRKELEAGLELVRRVVRARKSEFLPYLGTLSALLLEKDGVVAVGSVLVGRKGIDAFLDLADCCTDRLGVFNHSLGVATLRALKIDGLPEDMTVEPLDGLLLRVLYRLRSLGEREPLDPASLTVASLMLSAVISAGGIGAADAEEALEQLALVVDILSFHCPSFAEPTYPRLETLRDLVRVIKHHPQLAKNAVSALLAASEATARSTDAHSPEKAHRAVVVALKAVVKAVPIVGRVVLRGALSRRDTSDGNPYTLLLGTAAPDPATEDALKEDLRSNLSFVLASARSIPQAKFACAQSWDSTSWPGLGVEFGSRQTSVSGSIKRAGRGRAFELTVFTGYLRLPNAMDAPYTQTLNEMYDWPADGRQQGTADPQAIAAGVQVHEYTAQPAAYQDRAPHAVDTPSSTSTPTRNSHRAHPYARSAAARGHPSPAPRPGNLSVPTRRRQQRQTRRDFMDARNSGALGHMERGDPANDAAEAWAVALVQLRRRNERAAMDYNLAQSAVQPSTSSARDDTQTVKLSPRVPAQPEPVVDDEQLYDEPMDLSDDESQSARGQDGAELEDAVAVKAVDVDGSDEAVASGYGGAGLDESVVDDQTSAQPSTSSAPVPAQPEPVVENEQLYDEPMDCSEDPEDLEVESASGQDGSEVEDAVTVKDIGVGVDTSASIDQDRVDASAKEDASAYTDAGVTDEAAVLVECVVDDESFAEPSTGSVRADGSSSMDEPESTTGTRDGAHAKDQEPEHDEDSDEFEPLDEGVVVDEDDLFEEDDGMGWDDEAKVDSDASARHNELAAITYYGVGRSQNPHDEANAEELRAENVGASTSGSRDGADFDFNDFDAPPADAPSPASSDSSESTVRDTTPRPEERTTSMTEEERARAELLDLLAWVHQYQECTLENRPPGTVLAVICLSSAIETLKVERVVKEDGEEDENGLVITVVDSDQCVRTFKQCYADTLSDLHMAPPIRKCKAVFLGDTLLHEHYYAFNTLKLPVATDLTIEMTGTEDAPVWDLADEVVFDMPGLQKITLSAAKRVTLPAEKAVTFVRRNVVYECDCDPGCDCERNRSVPVRLQNVIIPGLKV